MKYTLAIAALMVAMVGGSAFAEEGRVSKNQLASLGLAGLEEMSDVQGREIRGQGFAFAASTAVSALPGTATSNAAIALGFNHADAATGALSEGDLDILIGGPTGPLLSIQAKISVGSAGYARSNSN